MTAEITTIRTASETAALLRDATPSDLDRLDPRTLTAITELLQAHADLARAQRPIVLHGPDAYTPAIAPDTAAYSAHVRIPTPPPTVQAPPGPRTHRPVMWGDKAFWFGVGIVASGVLGAIIATSSGAIWVLTLSAAGALTVTIGAAAINRAERHS